mgnify:FL=1
MWQTQENLNWKFNMLNSQDVRQVGIFVRKYKNNESREENRQANTKQGIAFIFK